MIRFCYVSCQYNEIYVRIMDTKIENIIEDQVKTTHDVIEYCISHDVHIAYIQSGYSFNKGIFNICMCSLCLEFLEKEKIVANLIDFPDWYTTTTTTLSSYVYKIYDALEYARNNIWQ